MMRSIAARALILYGASLLLSMFGWIANGGIADTLHSGGNADLPLPRVPDSLALGPVELGGPAGQSVGAIAALALWPLQVIAAPFVAAGRAVPLLIPAAGLVAVSVIGLVAARVLARQRRNYVRLRITPFRTDDAGPADVVAMMEAIQRQLLERWWRRLAAGQPSVALEVLFARSAESGVREATLTVTCPATLVGGVRAAVAGCYPHSTLLPETRRITGNGYVLRLKKRHDFIRRIKVVTGQDRYDTPIMDQLLGAIGETGESALVQLSLTPTPALFDWYAGRKYRRAEADAADPGVFADARLHRASLVHQRQLEGGLDIQHHALFFTELRIMATSRPVCEAIAATLSAHGAENRLIERGTSVRHGQFGVYRRRVERGEGNPLPSWHKAVFASSELATLWHLPSLGFSKVPLHRTNTPRMPAPPAAYRPPRGRGLFRDEHGPVSFSPETLSQNMKIVGAVEQGKSSTLVSGIEEDLLLRGRECIILLDPKGDSADDALSKIPRDRKVTFLDLARPMVGFNPLWVPGVPADTIADYVLSAMRNLFDDGDIKASSDRYLRNAIIAVLHYEDDRATLWHVQRVLSVGPQGAAYRRAIGEDLAHLPEIKEIVEFFRSELTTQLKDSGQTTTAKLDAPANKLARFVNSQSIKRVLQETNEVIDFDQLIRGAEILIVKGAMGRMGDGNTAVVMQLLTGMLDAALARQQDELEEADRIPVSFNCDEAPLVFTRGFARTMALKRSAKLRTRAAWQTNSQWIDRDLRSQLDGLFAHHVWCATPSSEDARSAIDVMMARYTDNIRPEENVRQQLRVTPDHLLNLGRYEQCVSAVSTRGRLQPFFVTTNRHEKDPAVIDHHLQQQWTRQQRDGSLEAWLRRPLDATDAAETTEGEGQLTVEAILAAASAPDPQPTPAPAPPADQTEQASALTSPPAGGGGGEEPEPGTPPASRGRQAEDRPPAGSEQPVAPSPTVEASDERAPAASEPARAAKVSVEGLNELAALDMMVSVKRGRPVVLPGTLEQAVLAGLANTRDRSMTTAQVRTNWFSKRSTAEAVRALSAAVDHGWLRSLSVEQDGSSEPLEGYALTSSGTRALAAAKAATRPLRPTELEILAWLAELRVAFSTQIGRRWFPGLRPSTLQRHMRKLFDAGLVDRFQFVFSNGSGSPTCYLITQQGIEAAQNSIGPHGTYLNPRSELSPPDLRDPAARQARHDLHVSGWMLALIDSFEGNVINVRGPQSAQIQPPRQRTRDGWRRMGPDDIALPAEDGAFLHSFKTHDGQGNLVPVEAFRRIAPDAAAEVQLRGRGNRRHELLVEVDLTERPSKQRGKFERYDHFLTGWHQELDRYGKHMGIPLVVFVCATETQALQFLAAADESMTARIAIPGQSADTWRYPAREQLLFVAEADAHTGDLTGLRVPPLPIDVREQLSDGTHTGREAARVCRPRATTLTEMLAARPPR